MDESMERQLAVWWLEQVKQRKAVLPLRVIKQKARQESSYRGTFKASKGWLDKFMKRYDIERQIEEILAVPVKEELDCI